MPWTTIDRFTDPAACERAIQGVANIEIYPTTRGQFDTEITKVRFDRLWMQRFHSSLPQVITCEHPADRQAISFLTEAKSPKLFYCGREVLPGDIVVSRRDIMHKRFDANIRKGAMSLSKDELNAAFEALMGRELPEKQDMCIVRPDTASMSRLLNLHKAVGQLARDSPEILELPEVDRALELQLIHSMVRCLYATDVGWSRAGSSGSAAMLRFEEFLEANPDRPLYLVEICAALNIAERTLRTSCEEHLGMGPIRYLTLRRMHLVRRALVSADPSETTVTRTVTDHGFWELGRFSVAYRAMFGEKPSETLRRPASPTAIGLDRPSALAVIGRPLSL
jgi:AraC-like DNA-binding protein